MTLKKNLLTKAAALMGSKGGHAGRGQAKRRGGASHYRNLQKRSVEARLRRKSLGKG
ncbi:MAG: hypothetical protein VB980_05865 [Opitutales bacterium]